MDVSVIVPTYNRAWCLARALDSVFAQTVRAREVIVIDDGSGDDTARLVRERYPRALYAYQEHAGVSAARNHGMRLARGEWLALLDSDDEWRHEKLSLQARRLSARPALRLVHCDELWIRDGQVLAQRAYHAKHGGEIFQHCLPRCAISPSAAVLHRSLIDDYGNFDETLPVCEDYDLWLRVTAHEAVGFVPLPLVVKYGGHADQLSRTVPALDRFRVRALARLLHSGTLNEAQTVATLATLASKIEIVIAGAKKRGLDLEVAELHALYDRHFA